MDTPRSRLPRALAVDARVEVAACAGLAAAAACLLVLVVPRGGDLAAHLYRTALVEHGSAVWDNLWFAGEYPLASYSLLYYPLAALAGNAALGIGGVVAAAGLFASLVRREWSSIGAWPGLAFSVLVAGQAFTAAYPYDVGMATLLAALWALQRGRNWLAAACTVATVGFSPLAFVFLVIALVAVFLRQRRPLRSALPLAAAVLLATALEFTALTVLPSPGMSYPYGTWRFLLGLVEVAFGVALSVRGRGGWPLASLFAVWATASALAYAIPSPIGHNLARASVFLVPLMLVAAALADFRPRRLAVAAIAAALAANVVPYLTMIPVRSQTTDADAAFWRPVVDFLHAHLQPGFRVEVVPTANHWEAYYLPQAGIPLARGWYRQLDEADNPALYAPRLTPAGYRDWLRRSAVRYVVLAHVQLEAIDAAREARLVAGRRSGLVRVLRSPQATIFELPRATPVLTGPGGPEITALTATTIAGRVSRPGRYLLRVHFTPYWQLGGAASCVSPSRDAMTRLVARHAGRFTLRAVETPSGLLADLVDGDAPACSSR